MSCTTFYAGDTAVHRLDPRPRIIVTMAFTLMVALSDHSGVLCLAAACGAFLIAISRIPPRAVAKRLLRLNLFMALLFILVPATFPGTPAFMIASVPYSREGLLWSAAVTLKANAIVMVFAALIGTIDPFVLGHAFHHLRVPSKLIHLFMFTLRYTDILHHEYMDLLRAMKARSFRPRMRMHTYRSYAYLVGMLMVRSLERSERIMDAMRCRGFKGEFYVIRHFRFGRRDAAFCMVSIAFLAVLAAGVFTGAGRLW